MAITVTVTPGYVFQAGEQVTADKLNKLGNPTIEIAGAVGQLSLQNNSIEDAHVKSTAAIALSKLGSDVVVVQTGMSVAYGGSLPSGYLSCDGQHYDSTGTYAALFAVIGYTYGRTDSAGTADAAGTFFKVPNVSGEVIKS